MEKLNILEMHAQRSDWMPPAVNGTEIVRRAAKEMNVTGRKTCFYIFRTAPYIDAFFLCFNEAAVPELVRRFTFREGYVWSYDDERFFHFRCVRSGACFCPSGPVDEIYSRYSALHPEWHLKRYYTHNLRVLDHIYHCMQQNTVKEMLYKAGLDELAVHVDDLDEINLLAARPSDLYDGLPVRVLRALNCGDGAALLSTAEDRKYLRALSDGFPDLFDRPLNEAQCCYLSMLIRGDLTPGETGRLFRERKAEFNTEWCRAILGIRLAAERNLLDYRAFVRVFREEVAVLDPIYRKYLSGLKPGDDLTDAKRIHWLLTAARAEYDRRFRVSNRLRVYEWQERTPEYILRYPQTVNDFIRESVYMQNCLPAYLEAVVSNDTTILFLRKADDIHQPFITIEVQKNELQQAYHRFNRECSRREKAWIAAWCKRHGIGTGHFLPGF